MNRTQLVFLDMLRYSFENKNKLCLFFVSKQAKVCELYGYIPKEFADLVHINLSNHTIHCDDSGSKIMIKTPATQPDHLRGIEIDIYEENGFASYETWKMLKERTK